jgi:hypothetical protein
METPWHVVGLFSYGYQASAITVLSTGQTYHGMGGLYNSILDYPIAMVVIYVTFIPLYHKYKVPHRV